MVGPKAGLCHHPLPSFLPLVSSLVQPQHLPWESWILLDLKSQNQNLIFPLTLLTCCPICPMPLCVWPLYFSTGVNNWFLKDSLLCLKIPFSLQNEASFTSCAGHHTNTTLGITGHPAPTFLSFWPHGLVHHVLLPIFHWGCRSCKSGEIPTNPSWSVTFP